MYPSNPSVQNEPYPQRVASTTVMTLARHVRSAAVSWHSMARAQLSRMACRVQPLGIIAKNKSTSDFPIETLSKIEDFHGFPPHRWLPGAYWVYIWVWKFWTWHIPGQTDFFCWNLPSFWLNPNHLRLFGCSIFISWWIDSWLSLDPAVRKRPRNQYWPNHSNSQSCCPANTQGLLLYNPFTQYYCFFWVIPMWVLFFLSHKNRPIS